MPVVRKTSVRLICSHYDSINGTQTSTRFSFQNRCHVNGTSSSAVTTDVSERRSTVMERMTAEINPMSHLLVVSYDSRFAVVR